jgi:histidyl-tRNA synthetase
MAKASKSADGPRRPEARLPRGFRDVEAPELAVQSRMIATLSEVFERYGYDRLETPAFEFTDALGKFLPDTDRPNEGVFSVEDDDRQWMSLRYDMTAPLARYVAENIERLARPYRRYTWGPVWRNEKPGPGRYRQFLQFDADTVGTENVAADAEACMLMADAVEALGIPRGQYRIRLNNRKVLDGVLELAGIDPASAADAGRRLAVLRAMDKLDKFGLAGVRQLLGEGRRDESGDFTRGAGLASPAIEQLAEFLAVPTTDPGQVLEQTRAVAGRSPRANEGLAEAATIEAMARAAGYGGDRIGFDPSVVRGLDYYTGPVFEAELTFAVKNEDGETVRFGSVGGGGRYDDLVARFTGERVPATGFSIGVSRLQAALGSLEGATAERRRGPVVVLVMDRAELPRYQRLAAMLRQAGIRAEMYLGTAGMKPQMKYADRRNAPCVVIQGSDERVRGEVQIKDLVEGAKAAAAIKDNREWKDARPAQVSVGEAEMVATVRAILARHGG